MSKCLWSIVILVAITCSSTSFMSRYPTDFFQIPVAGQLFLSGTFGELRLNHFHAGIDIKGKVGDVIYASGAGYVSRIKVEAGGYGRAIYIRHPNGYTSVYAHLDRFTPEIEQWVRERQYGLSSFEVDLKPEPAQFSFNAGEEIGRMGVKGNSFGPHLHFEIRETSSQHPINPLLFGLEVEDDLSPRMRKLQVYLLDELHRERDARSYNLYKSPEGYRLAGDTIRTGGWRIGLGLACADQMNGVNNNNGIYSLEVEVDGQLVYAFDMESFSFHETRYMNAHLDYGRRLKERTYYYRCYAMPGNGASIYNVLVNDGVIPIFEAKPQQIDVHATDLNGNKSSLRFWVLRGDDQLPKVEPWQYELPRAEVSLIERDGLRLRFRKNTFYEDLRFRLAEVVDSSAGLYSKVYQLHNGYTPVHRYFDIAIKAGSLPSELEDKAVVAFCGEDGTVFNCGGTYKDGWVASSVRLLGNYCIQLDTTAPTIEPVDFSENMSGKSAMRFRIDDNIGSSGKAKGLQYEARVDGTWIMMEYDAKNKTLIYEFDQKVSSGRRHRLELEVWDDRGNKAVLERMFIR